MGSEQTGLCELIRPRKRGTTESSRNNSQQAAPARRLGRGEHIAAKAYPVADIAEVSRALADASTSRQAADHEVRFLMREVEHRSKNQMTVIAATAQ
ncbi:MAG: hypothetical protein MO846_03960 [Candidatus Devosia symbiotica]|nr:hypothetical protein [Candidatus Devosia symbiotica]